MVRMTMITIEEKLGLERNIFKNLADFLGYLEEQGFAVTLRKLPHNEVTVAVQKRADEARKQYRKSPASLRRL